MSSPKAGVSERVTGPLEGHGETRADTSPGETRIEVRLTLMEPGCSSPRRSWSDEVMARRYRAAAEAFDTAGAFRSPVVRDGLAALRQIELPGASVLDVGCGFGHWAKVLAASPAPLCSWRYTGLEVCEQVVEVCRWFDPESGFDVGVAEVLPYADDSFDVVLCSGVLSYADDWRRCLRQCARVARGHVVLLRTPVVKYHPTTRCRQMTRSAAGTEQHDLTLFSRDEFRTALGRAGMRILHEDYTDEVLRVDRLGERLFFLNHLLKAPGSPGG
jgi:SAM-dependent methyltransferase